MEAMWFGCPLEIKDPFQRRKIILICKTQSGLVSSSVGISARHGLFAYNLHGLETKRMPRNYAAQKSIESLVSYSGKGLQARIIYNTKICLKREWQSLLFSLSYFSLIWRWKLSTIHYSLLVSRPYRNPLLTFPTPFASVSSISRAEDWWNCHTNKRRIRVFHIY